MAIVLQSDPSILQRCEALLNLVYDRVREIVRVKGRLRATRLYPRSYIGSLTYMLVRPDDLPYH
uniref:Uncharacterized protein n=1 Tax=viral metagenome TaxID=1070528 RepID=A0A6C0JSB6_9ZZZZ